MKLNKLIKFLESVAPPAYQESYDNAGLIVGDPNTKIKGVLVCLDSTEAIIQEAIKRKCNVIIAHHPIVFKGLKKFNGKSYVERTVMMAIKYDICIYAIHTNLDNVYHNGVNAKIAEKLKLKKLQILAPKQNQVKLQFYLNVEQINTYQKASTKSIAPLALQNIHSVITAKSSGKKEAAEVKYETTVLQHEVRNVMQYLQSNTGTKNITHHILPISRMWWCRRILVGESDTSWSRYIYHL